MVDWSILVRISSRIPIRKSSDKVLHSLSCSITAVAFAGQKCTATWRSRQVRVRTAEASVQLLPHSKTANGAAATLSHLPLPPRPPPLNDPRGPVRRCSWGPPGYAPCVGKPIRWAIPAGRCTHLHSHLVLSNDQAAERACKHSSDMQGNS